jgi:large subunit ribosomal protein L17
MAYAKLGKTTSHRRAMFRNMVTSLFNCERIQTTEPKAKEVNRIAEKLITLAKRGDLHARRQVLAFVNDEKVVGKLFDTIAPKYEGRPGGYTRIIKVGARRGDAAEMVILELV